MVPCNTALYTAQNPEVLLGKIRFDTMHALEEAEQQLKAYQALRREPIHFVFKGFETALFKAKKILKEAQHEVYMNADFDLSCFREEFSLLKKHSIRVVVFSFYDLNIRDGAEFYSHYRNMTQGHEASRLMVVADNEISLIADRGTALQEWNGTVSNNMLWNSQ